MNRSAALFFAALVLAGAALDAAVARAQSAAPAEIAEQVAVCGACHGQDGRPVTEETPIIWGQEEYYLYVQMRDIQAGRRVSEVMSGVVADLSRDQMKALGKYFSRQPWPNLAFKPRDGDGAVAQNMAAAGQCSQCHLGGFEGNSRIPRAAGQEADYLEKTMLDFKNRRRMNAPDKASLLETFSDDDIAAMARYLASLQPH